MEKLFTFSTYRDLTEDSKKQFIEHLLNSCCSELTQHELTSILVCCGKNVTKSTFKSCSKNTISNLRRPKCFMAIRNRRKKIKLKVLKQRRNYKSATVLKKINKRESNRNKLK